MRIVIFGIGFVGLSNAIVLSKHNDVVLIDVDRTRINLINKGQSTIADKDIEDFFKNNDIHLLATDDLKKCKNADIVIIATPTDYDSQMNHFDTSSIENVLNELLKINRKCTVIIKSTVPVGYTRHLIDQFGYDNIFFSPEFLREGHALFDNLYPSRIIVGVSKKDKKHIEKAQKFVDLLKGGALKKDALSIIMGLEEAESVKLFSNTYLAMRVAYFNELDTFAEINNLNTQDIINGVCADPRIGHFYNNPSFGYGGYCLPKDTKQLNANFSNVPSCLPQAVIESNAIRKNYIANQILARVNDGDTIGIFRLVMKTGTSDFRQSSIQDIINYILNSKRKVRVIIYEPLSSRKNFMGVEIIDNIDEFKHQSNLIIANRFEECLNDVVKKLYTRDIFKRD